MNIFIILINNFGCFEISGLRETAYIGNYDENALIRDVPYWMITYYFLVIFSIYMLIFCDIWCTYLFIFLMGFGALIGKNTSQLKNCFFLF